MSRRARPWPMLALLLAALAMPSVASATGPAPAARGDTLSVVTLNIYHDRADWPQRLPLIVAGLRELRPDVIALQEVLQHEQLPNQARTIAEALGYRMHFVSTDPPGSVRRYGNAILTPHPVLARGWQRLRPHEDSRTVAHLRIAVDGRPFDVYATHLHHTPEGEAIRRQQLQDLLAHVAASSQGAARLLLGDFNAVVSAAEMQPLREGYLDSYASVHPGADAQPVHTTLNPAFFDHGRRIDHILVERGRFEVVDAAIVLDRAGADGSWPSDHFGVLAVLRPLPPARGAP